jgi:dTDP-glucose pyrophosphorylase
MTISGTVSISAPIAATYHAGIIGFIRVSLTAAQIMAAVADGSQFGINGSYMPQHAPLGLGPPRRSRRCQAAAHYPLVST